MSVSLRLVEHVKPGRQPGYGVYVNLILNLQGSLVLIYRMVVLNVDIHTYPRAYILWRKE